MNGGGSAIWSNDSNSDRGGRGDKRILKREGN